MAKQEVVFFWFRRDLRLEDNVGLFQALQSQYPVIPLFIFDETILEGLPKNDPRVGFIHESLSKIQLQLQEKGKSLLIRKGKPELVWEDLLQEYAIQKVFWNKDYEPNAMQRDAAVTDILQSNRVKVVTYKDQVIFEKEEIVKSDGLPYTVYTPFKNKWLEKYRTIAPVLEYDAVPYFSSFLSSNFAFPSIEDIGF